ncbi:hypothetical protein PJU52_001582 [Klebsiella michiganensis]|uniref:hypothetical protein n=1 Tax=Klebsiella michiganensis TaxID=1134687 RepID=UPI000D658010|nr:hypothetical protein [Klebsiella michiganensis]EKV7896087.1 hypothetical protein [Klebsiella michiganensis]ELB7344292.1 hypothetical protein [Klebsiella michiganensis]ELC2233312.1 hypothetical protein [Klebsiella michiganensis]ELJ6256694.1 hypothetical protein [Klebsiella michiganensis]MCW9668655.1 hypothetical protein [Klebsiella michiganensis]
MKFLNNVNLKRVYVLLSILFAVFVCGWLINHFHQQNDFDCSANLRIESGSFGFDANFKTFLLMRGNNSGYFDVSGKVIVDNVKYNVERSYHFIYAKKANNIYHLTQTTLSKRKADNMIEGMMQKVFFSPDPDSGRYIKIQKMKNGWIVRSLYSPSFICVNN